MLSGVYLAKKKNGTVYYRSNITHQNKHISLGSFDSEDEAHAAYLEAGKLLSSEDITRINCFHRCKLLSFDKVICLLNYRDNHMYIANPIYLCANYFLYYLSPNEELKFDIDDLFFYSSHRILRRQGHLYVNDYGMQVSLLSRYGIKNYAVCGRDYEFANNDCLDLRYSNIIIHNRYNGVFAYQQKGVTKYRTFLHINGNHTIGTYSTEAKAAVAYNRAVDLALEAGIKKNYTPNYVLEYTPREYADIYTRIKISPRFLSYLQSLAQNEPTP